MSRDPTLYLQDIEESCQKISAYTRGMTFAAFAADAKTIDAVAKNLEIIRRGGQALARRLEAQACRNLLAQIAGLRDMSIRAPRRAKQRLQAARRHAAAPHGPRSSLA
jgi:uncharacterized protein with HEPN domain